MTERSITPTTTPAIARLATSPSSLYGTNDKDQVYDYDGLHRLKNFDEGTLCGTTISGAPDRQQDWTLDQLGNWDEGYWLRDGVEREQTGAFNEANEITNVDNAFEPQWADPDYDDDANDEIRHFYYNRQWQVVEERLGSATTADKQYVYHPHYVDAIAMCRDGGGNQHYFLQDANSNVTAVADWTGRRCGKSAAEGIMALAALRARRQWNDWRPNPEIAAA